MRTRYLMTLGAAALAAACSLPPPADVDYDADLRDATPVDAAVDAAPVCVPDSIVCDEGTGLYVDCDSEGAPEVVIDCPLGCAPDVEKCLDVVASNGLTGYLDQARDDADVVSVSFTGASTMNTDTGVVMIGANEVEIPNTTANGIRVFMFKFLTISGTLKVTGSLPVAFVADGEVLITGVLDVSADLHVNGPGAVTAGDCVGHGVRVTSESATSGGGGAGHADSGALGGPTFTGMQHGSAGQAAIDPDLDSLRGGCQGGLAGYIVFPTPPSSGGGGGGAIQIVSRRSVAIMAGGQIDASGGGGNGIGAGAGGGSGGSVLIEAPEIAIDGAGSVISTKGGSGSSARASGATGAGRDGDTDGVAAPGGTTSGYASGGNGGTEAVTPTVGGTGTASAGTQNSGGGGGGSVGETRLNSAGANAAPTGGAAIRSRYSTGAIGSRLSPD
jgi:hypothetical protein